MKNAVVWQVLAGDCLPSNDGLSGKLSGPLNTLVGAFGGLIPTLVGVGLVILTLLGVFYAMMRKDVSMIYKSIVVIVTLPFVAVLAALIYQALWGPSNSGC